jgi:hypothetical protein
VESGRVASQADGQVSWAEQKEDKKEKCWRAGRPDKHTCAVQQGTLTFFSSPPPPLPQFTEWHLQVA